MSGDRTALLSLKNWRIAHPAGDWRLALEHLPVFPQTLHLLSGPNMSGKSTLLRVLAGQQAKFSRTAAQARSRDASVLLSAADDPMFRDWSVRDNVFVVAGRKIGGEDVERLESFLAGINQALQWNLQSSAPLHDYSTGARAFIQLARAFVFRPALYLLDEITPSLDDAKLGVFIDKLLSLSCEGMGVVFVSHSERDRQKVGCTFCKNGCDVRSWEIVSA